MSQNKSMTAAIPILFMASFLLQGNWAKGQTPNPHARGTIHAPEFDELKALVKAWPKVNYHKGRIEGNSDRGGLREQANLLVTKILSDERYFKAKPYLPMYASTPYYHADKDVKFLHDVIILFELWDQIGAYRDLIHARNQLFKPFANEITIRRIDAHLFLLSELGYRNKEVIKYCKAEAVKFYHAKLKFVRENPTRDTVVKGEYSYAILWYADALKTLIDIDKVERQRYELLDARTLTINPKEEDLQELRFYEATGLDIYIHPLKYRRQFLKLKRGERIEILVNFLFVGAEKGEPLSSLEDWVKLELLHEADAKQRAQALRKQLATLISKLPPDAADHDKQVTRLKRRAYYCIVHYGTGLTNEEKKQIPSLRWTAEELAPPKRK